MIKYIRNLSIILIILSTSCNDMNDIIEEYLDRGEINYIGKVESAYTIGGSGRIQFVWQVNNDPRIEECIIYWNSKSDSVVYSIDREALDADGFISFILNDIAEGDYVFEMYHTGSKGYRSIKTEVSGKVYGDLYVSQLNARKIQSITAYPDSVVLTWAVPDPDESGSTLFYPNSGGNIVEKNISLDEYETILTDYQVGGSLKVITTYLPEISALDEFVVESSEQNFPDYFKLNKGSWTTLAYVDDSNDETIGYSSQEAMGEGGSPNGRIIAMFDDKTSTYWHASWKTSSKYPHWFIVDMGSEYVVTHIEITKRQGDTRGETGHQFFTCTEAGTVDVDDPTTWNWIDQGKYSFDPTLDASQLSTIADTPTARYIKVYISEEFKGAGDYAMISDFSVYGRPAK